MDGETETKALLRSQGSTILLQLPCLAVLFLACSGVARFLHRLLPQGIRSDCAADAHLHNTLHNTSHPFTNYSRLLRSALHKTEPWMRSEKRASINPLFEPHDLICDFFKSEAIARER